MNKFLIFILRQIKNIFPKKTMQLITYMKTKNDAVSPPPLRCLRGNSSPQLHRKFAKPIMQNPHMIKSNADINYIFFMLPPKNLN